MGAREEALDIRTKRRSRKSPLIDEAEALADVLNIFDRFATALERIADAYTHINKEKTGD